LPRARKPKGQWWKADKGAKVHEKVAAQVRALITGGSTRISALNAWRALYLDRTDEVSRPALTLQGIHRSRKARFNVTRSAVDSLHSRIVKNRPVPWVLTEGGDYSAQERAKGFTKYLEGEFYRLTAHPIGSMICHDALVYGTGAIKIYEEAGRPAIERTWVGELITDPLEERYNCVRTLYQVKPYDREVVEAMFPEHAEQIRQAARMSRGASMPIDPTGRSRADLIDVVEAWRLPYIDQDGEPHGGRRVIVVDKATLLDEEWTDPEFPFVFLRASRDPESFWGVGMVEKMAGTQSELNMLSEAISDGFRLANVYLAVYDEAAVTIEHVADNEVMRVIRIKGGPGMEPKVITPPGASDQHLMREDTLIQRALHMEGISELNAHAQKPPGLNSGKALQVHEDIESVRHMQLGRAYEQMFMDLAEQIVCVTDRILDNAKENEDDSAQQLKIAVEQDGELEILSYGEVSLGGMEYRIKTFPVSQLSQSPAGRLQQVEDMMRAGLVDETEARELLDWPDLERANTLKFAGRKLAEKLVEDALRGKQTRVVPELPLDYLHRWGVLRLMQAERDGAPETKLQRLRDLLAFADSLIQQAMPPPMPQPPPGAQAPPPGPPGPPPGAAGPMPLAPGMPGAA